MRPPLLLQHRTGLSCMCPGSIPRQRIAHCGVRCRAQVPNSEAAISSSSSVPPGPQRRQPSRLVPPLSGEHGSPRSFYGFQIEGPKGVEMEVFGLPQEHSAASSGSQSSGQFSSVSSGSLDNDSNVSSVHNSISGSTSSSGCYDSISSNLTPRASAGDPASIVAALLQLSRAGHSSQSPSASQSAASVSYDSNTGSASALQTTVAANQGSSAITTSSSPVTPSPLTVPLHRTSSNQAMHRHQPPYTSSTLEELLQLLRPALQADKLDPQQLVSVAVSLAKLQLVDAPLFSALLAATQPHLVELPPHSLASLIWALGNAGARPSGAWLSACYRSMEGRLDDLDVQDIANTLWGLAVFDLMPDVWLLDTLVERALIQMAAEGRREGTRNGVIVCSRTGQLSQAGQDPATIVTVLARYYFKYNYRVSDEWLSYFLSITQPSLRHYLPADLVSLIHSVVTLNHMPPRAWMHDFYAVIRQRLVSDPTLPTSAFSRLLWALARVDYTPPQTWLREFAALSRCRLRALRFRGQVEILWAMACWDCKPDREWLREWLRVSAVSLHEYRPAQLATCMRALAMLGCKAPTAWLSVALAGFLRQLSGAQPSDQLLMLESLVRVCDDREWLSKQTASLQAIGDAASLKFEVYDALMHARLVLALSRAGAGCPGTAWLAAQTSALAKCWSPEIEAATAAELRGVYAAWNAEINQALAAELEAAS